MVGVVVEILHLALIEHRALDVFLSPELVVGQRQRADVAHPALDVRALVSRGQVVQFEDAKQVVPDLDQHALAKPCRLNR